MKRLLDEFKPGKEAVPAKKRGSDMAVKDRRHFMDKLKMKQEVDRERRMA